MKNKLIFVLLLLFIFGGVGCIEEVIPDSVGKGEIDAILNSGESISISAKTTMCGDIIKLFVNNKHIKDLTRNPDDSRVSFVINANDYEIGSYTFEFSDCDSSVTWIINIESSSYIIPELRKDVFTWDNYDWQKLNDIASKNKLNKTRSIK